MNLCSLLITCEEFVQLTYEFVLRFVCLLLTMYLFRLEFVCLIDKTYFDLV